MSPQYLILAATAGAVCLAIFAVLSAWATRRTGDARAAALAARLAAAERRARASQASAEAFDTALVAIEDGRASLITGEDSLAACAAVLGVSQVDTQAVVDALAAAVDALVREAATAGERRQGLRWASQTRGRRAFRVTAQPLEGGGVGVWTEDATEAEDAGDALKRHIAAHDQTLNNVGDAVAVFDREKRLSFYNAAFAELWGLEPAWLADKPTHAEVLDRLRQRRRLPETIDYAKFKAAELARYELLKPSEEAIWPLPSERTLRVISQPHPLGGLLMLFADITPE